MEVCLRGYDESRGALDESYGVAVLVEILGDVVPGVAAADDYGAFILVFGGDGACELRGVD
jgi:hypothetical protein